MGRNRSHAWLTSVINDDTITSALVLAESLRRTRTCKRIGVITCVDVSIEGRLRLRTAFDDFFFMDESLVPSWIGNEKQLGQVNMIRAKIFAFSLEMFEKGIFLGPSTLALENIDGLFEGQGDSLMDPFMLQPSMALCQFLIKRFMSSYDASCSNENDLLTTFLDQWSENNLSRVKKARPESNLSGISIIKFAVEKCALQITSGNVYQNPAIVQFTDISANNARVSLAERLMIMRNANILGLTEKVIVEAWLRMFEENVSSLTASSISALNWKLTSGEQVYEKEPIAIIGMSCRFPCANNLHEFWNLLHEGKEGIRQPPAFRWNRESSIFGMGPEMKTNAGFLSGPVDEFDSKFFGLSPKDTITLDPQGRLLHEVLWESLEDGGVDPLELRGSLTGMFVGSWMYDYKEIVQASTERDFFRTYMGNSIGATAARLSFLLGLTGPNIATESGCSSAMVAVHMAVNSLRNGESNLALAGGVNLLLHPFKSDIIEYVIAPDGRCKTFDEKANGFGRAEGCGVLVLKRLNDALRDKDNIWAVIKGSAISQEGLSRSLRTPTVHSEALAMELALKDAGVEPEQVSFVETHGTGTSVGDPMEVAATAKAYHTDARVEPLVIGSVKTNVGHTESCAGITGIIKTVLAMQNEMIPKHLNLDKINPEVNLEAIPAIIPVDPIPWPKVQGQPRFAGVSSFGITGTDGHVILEEAPDYQLPKFHLGLERPIHLIKFSGKSKEAMDDLLKSYQHYFQETPGGNLADAAFSANTGRASFNDRAFLLASNYEQAAQMLQAGKIERAQLSNANPGKICFLFTGQGSQYTGVAKSLYETSPVFRTHFDICENRLIEEYNISIRDALWESRCHKLGRTIYSQTSIFCVEYCLLKLWQSWGIQPDCVLGHSLGEFCAAVAAGLMTFVDALKLVAERSRLIDNLPRGSMLVIKASGPEVENMMTVAKVDLDYAALNSHEQTVLAGDSSEISHFHDVCRSSGIKSIVLEASHAFHSRHMTPMLEKYRQIIESIQYSQKAACHYISGVNGGLLENPTAEINADYWIRHTREKVSFLGACKALKLADCRHFVEIGPQPVLSSLLLQNVDDDISISCYPSLRRNGNEWETMLTSLGKLYMNGFKVDWNGFDKPYARRKIPSSLPFHPFHRKPFWVDCSETNWDPFHPLIGSSLKNASTVGIFQNNFSLKCVPYVKDHCMGNRILMPGAVFTEMCLAAGYCVSNSLIDKLDPPMRPMALENMTIVAPLEVKEDRRYQLQVTVQLKENACNEEGSPFDDGHGFLVQVYRHSNEDSVTNGKWVIHASTIFHPVTSTKDILCKWKPDRVTEIMKSSDTLGTEKVYNRIECAGMKFGPNFRSIQRYWAQGGNNLKEEIVAEMNVPEDNDIYVLHPIVLDAFLQSVIFTTFRQTHSDALTLPVRVGKMVWLDNISNDSHLLYLHAWWEETDVCSMFILNEDLSPVAFMTDIELIETTVRTVEAMLEQQKRILPDAWEEVWKQIPGTNEHRAELTTMEAILQSEGLNERLNSIDERCSPFEKNNFRKLNRLVYLYTMRALFQLGWEPKSGDIMGVKEFSEKYGINSNFSRLIYFYFSMFEEEHGILEISGETQNMGDIWTIGNVTCGYAEKVNMEAEELYLTLQKESDIHVVVNVYKNIGAELSEILCGKKSALSILYPTQSSLNPGKNTEEYSAETYYQYHPSREESRCKVIEILSTIFQHLQSTNDAKTSSSEKKVYRILEVGAGTGSMSTVTVPLLSEICGDQFEYHFTDISPSFFAKAEVKLEAFQRNIKFCAFNMEESPLEQGIPLKCFDMILASNVLHAAKDLKQCLRNLRQMLRPQGVLFFTDSLNQDRGITFVFGLLEGYWRFEDFETRPHHSCVNGDTWRKLLLQSGFEYVSISEVYMETVGCITAGASSSTGYELWNDAETLLSPTNENTWILFAHEHNSVMEKVTQVLRANGRRVILVLPSKELVENDGEIFEILKRCQAQGIIYAWGLDEMLVEQNRIAGPYLQMARHFSNLTKPPKLFVLTKGVHAILESHYANMNPSAATLFGMTKTLKNENSENFLIRYVDLDDSPRYQDDMVDNILFELAMCKETRERERVQVAYREGLRYEPRFNRVIMAKNPETNDLQLPPSTERYQLRLPESRLINDLKFVSLDEESVGDGEVEVTIKTYSLNFRDLFSILKPSLDFEHQIGVGLDFSGVVSKVGRLVSPDTFQVGDRVFGMNSKRATLPSHLVIDSDGLLRIPKNMTFSEAATLPAIFCTSLYCLLNVAKIQRGETVLIHTGSGGVGLSAIQVAKHVGANIITTAGNPRKREYLKSLGIEYVFHSRSTSYKEGIMKVTNGRGVDVVLNSLTGPGFKEATLSVCAKHARFVEMSKLAVWPAEVVHEQRPDVEYTVVDLSAVDLALWRELLRKMEKYLYNGILDAIPHVRFDALRIRQAFYYFQKAKHIGKVVVSMPEVKAMDGQWKANVALFNGFSTYLITGGLGGIGFEVCKWMLSKGATDIVLIGRSPPKAEVAKEIENLNKGKGCNVVIKLGDVGDYGQCKAIIDEIVQSREGKPIRGIQHCAGVLRDNLYSNQSWDSFEAAFNPKVKGTWNLHNLTREMPLEHFIFYSSVTALAGTPGQANHTAANRFEDAFAHYRYSLGLPATSINWGQWSQVGCAKDVNVPGVLPVSVKRMLNGLEAVFRSPRIQVTFGDFESLSTWMIACPLFKHYLDERLLKKLKEGDGQSNHHFLPKSDQFWKEMDAAENKEEKMNVVSRYMKVILRGALRLEPDELISDDANMHELGVDSLMLIELKNSIQGLLGSRLTITANMLKDCNTIRDLATVIVNRMFDDGENASNMLTLPVEEFEELLKSDCTLEESIQSVGPADKMKTIFVTGSTGQLGPYILSALCKPGYKSVEKIASGHCPSYTDSNRRGTMSTCKIARSCGFHESFRIY